MIREYASKKKVLDEKLRTFNLEPFNKKVKYACPGETEMKKRKLLKKKRKLLKKKRKHLKKKRKLLKKKRKLLRKMNKLSTFLMDNGTQLFFNLFSLYYPVEV